MARLSSNNAFLSAGSLLVLNIVRRLIHAGRIYLNLGIMLRLHRSMLLASSPLLVFLSVLGNSRIKLAAVKYPVKPCSNIEPPASYQGSGYISCQKTVQVSLHPFPGRVLTIASLHTCHPNCTLQNQNRAEAMRSSDLWSVSRAHPARRAGCQALFSPVLCHFTWSGPRS